MYSKNELVLPLANAKKIKGSAGYFEPDQVKWAVQSSPTKNGTEYFVSVVLIGINDEGRRRGSAFFTLDIVPKWLEVPSDWIEESIMMCKQVVAKYKE